MAWLKLLPLRQNCCCARTDTTDLRTPQRRRISIRKQALRAHVKRFITLLSIVLCLVLPVRAQQPSDTPAPFDGDLQRLAEVLGALHYLRAVCGPNEGQKWRNEMQALIDAEAPSGERRRKIVASFNRGYRGFQQTYRTCTPAADLAIRRYLDEGAKIAREITARYAN